MEDNQFKQRLVGAIVLVSLGVIFIPLFLTGGDPAVSPITETNIPEKPEREFVSRIIPLDRQAPEPAPVEPASQSTESAQTSKSDEPEAAESAPVTAVADEPVVETSKPTPKPSATKPVVHKTVSAWVVQMGIFSSKQNAYNLRDKLRKHGFDAFVDTQHDNDTTNYRVRVGPEVKRESAEALVASLKKAVGLKGFVTKYP
ncbi:MAG: SPOR domain-containing protein [Granulosicoccaceae bacterium]